MMSYPPDHSQSGSSHNEHFEQLARIRRTLMTLLSKQKEAPLRQPEFSLFCSRKNYREDELHTGLNKPVQFGFSEN
jgi:hypothetical protein